MTNPLRLVTLATIVVGAGLLSAAHLAAVSPDERSQIRAADHASARFDKELGESVRLMGVEFGARAAEVGTDYPSLLKFVDESIARAPAAGPSGTTAYGREHSDAYRGADARRDLALQPFVLLRRYLKDTVIPDQAFVDSGKVLVRVNPGKLLTGVELTTGAPLRDLVVPAFEKARDRLEKQRTPAGSELLQRDLKTYARDAISQAKKGARRIDARLPFYFDLGTRPDDLFQRLAAVETLIESDLIERIDVLKPPG